MVHVLSCIVQSACFTDATVTATETLVIIIIFSFLSFKSDPIFVWVPQEPSKEMTRVLEADL